MDFKPNYLTKDGWFQVMLDEDQLSKDKPTQTAYSQDKELTVSKVTVYNTKTDRLSEKSLYYKENKGFYFKGSSSYWNKTPSSKYYIKDLTKIEVDSDEAAVSGWKLSDDLINKFTPIFKDFIYKIENLPEVVNEEDLTLNLTGKGITPYQAWSLLEILGYEHTDMNQNGWELDFWLFFEKQGCRRITLRGTGMTFELFLCYLDD